MSIFVELRRLIDQLRSQGIRLTLLAGWDKVVRWVTGHPEWRFTRITPQIYLGGQPTMKVLPRLLQLGVRGVVNMRKEYDYLKPDQIPGLRYLLLPTVDNTAPSLDDLYIGVEFMQDVLKNNGSVYVHCWEGLGRSPTMVAAYLVSTGVPTNEAWITIRRIRPFIRPNAAQISQLEAFAQDFEKRKQAKLAEEPPAVEVKPIEKATPPDDPLLDIIDEDGV